MAENPSSPKPAAGATPAAAASAPAVAPAPTGPQPPATRELRPPHFVLRTPDGLASYFDRENYRIVMSPHEPLSQFLAPAKLVEDKTPQPGHARQRIEYDFSGLDLATFAPMEALPASLLASLEEAVRAFYARVDDPASKATDHEKRLRRGFRLPDPDKEKDCYWVHGPRDDRRLLILWGCEAVRGTALSMMTRADAGNTPGVVEKLRARGMPWAILQREALALVIERRRPLSRFLATPVRDRAGAVTAVIHQGKNIPKDKLSPLKHVSPAEIAAFEKEAAAFYAGAQKENADTTGYEKELRRALRLPDPDKRPNQYFLHGGRLVILVQGDETPDTVLCPGSDAAIPMPPEETGPDGAKFVPETVVDRLRRRATPTKLRMILAGAAVVVVIAGLIAFEVFADRTPPKVVKVTAENDPTTVQVEFDEKIEASSLEGTTGIPEPIRVRAPGGQYVKVSSAKLDPNDAKKMLVKVEPLGEGDYELVLKGVRDRSRKHNAIAADTTKDFAFADTLPPELSQVSAHADDSSKLVLVFNEPLDARSLRERNNYSIPGFTVRGAEAGREPSLVVLTVDKPFENHGRYSLSIDGVADKAGNTPKGPLTRDFEYKDTIPPSLERVEAAASQVKVQLTFTKKLGGGAADPSLYAVEEQAKEGGWKPLDIRVARLPDETKPVVELITSPLHNGVLYRVSAHAVPDRADPPNVLAATDPKQFRYTGQEDKVPPGLGRPHVRDGTNNREIEVTFSEEVTAESATRAENYSFAESGTPIEDASSADGAMVRTVVLRVASPLAQGSRLTLRCTGLTDIVGNVNPEAASDQFWVSGMGVPEDTTLKIVSAEVQSGGTTILVKFNEDISAATAGLTSNYSVSGGKKVARVDWSSGKPTEVTLHLDGSTPLTKGTFALTVRNLQLADLPDTPQHSVTASLNAP